MNRSRPLHTNIGEVVPFSRSQMLAALTAILVLPIAFAASLFPVPYMLVAFGTMCLAASVIASALAWLMSTERNTDQITLWDVSGTFALIGIVAVLISRTDYPLPPLVLPG